MLIALMAFSTSSFSQWDVPPSVHDDLLLAIPADRYREASSLTTLRSYHRFSEYVIVGSASGTLRELSKRGIGAILLDTDPWSQPYAVVTVLPSRPLPDVHSGLHLGILLRSGDQQFVKGSARDFEALRTRGFSCVPVEPSQIPVEISTTYLSEFTPLGVNDTIASVIARVSDSTITSYIQGLQGFGTRYYSNANRDSVFSWVRHRFLDAGITDVVLDSFQYAGIWQCNVVATIPGTVNPSAEIIVGGHLDSYSSIPSQAPGADDNATGTTAALEMARVLKSINYQPALTIRLIGFATEEMGLIGSARYAQKARLLNCDIKVMMNYDMIGNRTQSQPDRDFYIVWYTGSEAFSNLHASIARAYTTLTPVLTTSYRTGSDSYSFYQQNYKTVFCIERDFSPYYHSPNDLLMYLDIPYARDIIKSGLAMLLTLDAMPPSVEGLQVVDRGNGTSLFAAWDSVAVQDWYRYRVSVGTSPGVYDTSHVQSARSRAITGLTAGVQYFIGVSIIDLTGREGVIVEQSGIPASVPLPPVGFTAEGIPNAIRLRWRENTEMDLRGYNIYRRPDTTGGFTRITPQPFPDTLWTDSVYTAGVYSYYITAVDSALNESGSSDTVSASVLVAVAGVGGTPFEFRLEQNYPNPFNPTTTMRYTVPSFRSAVRTERVTLRVFDVLGREVATLVDEEKEPGSYTAAWNAQAVSSGIYLCVLRAGSLMESIRMVLIR